MDTCACCNLEKPDTVALHCSPETSLCGDCLDWLVRRRDKQRAASDRIRVVGADPIFQVADVERATAHYERLGFEIDHYDEGYAFAGRGAVNIHLAHEPQPGPSTLYLHVNDAHQLADDWRKAGATVETPVDYDWGKSEGRHVDPDGNVIRFGSPRRS
jgi:catechol 2,3-dioxygenase-like lactoylglutathione lyase family enzyme